MVKKLVKNDFFQSNWGAQGYDEKRILAPRAPNVGPFAFLHSSKPSMQCWAGLVPVHFVHFVMGHGHGALHCT